MKLARRDPVVAAFAGILDGQRLWLAIEDQPGSLALRATGSGDVIASENEVPAEDQPGYRAARIDLDRLPGGDETAYDVVLVPGRGRPVPVRSDAPVPSRPGAARWRLARGDDGVLRVHRETAEEAVELVGLEVVPNGVRLTVDGGPSLALLADDEPALTLPVADGTVVLDAGALPDLPDQPLPVVVGEPGARRTVRRRANDLAEPGRGAPLPSLVDAEERERLRLRWSPKAQLVARFVKPEGDG